MEASEQELEWPRWAGSAVAAVAAGIAALTPFVHHEGARTPVLLMLLAVAVVPWVLLAAEVRVPPALFGAGVLVPLAVINWGGGMLGLDMSHDAQLSFLLLIWAVGTAGSHYGLGSGLLIAAAAILLPVGRGVITGVADPWAFWAFGIAMAAVMGGVLHRQQRLLGQLREAQAALAERAAVAERQRIAREVHDVIAHSLTVTMLHLTGARMALEKDPGAAAEALADAERLGRQALSDVRRTVGLLHRDEGGSTEVALPGITDVTELVAAYRAAGADIDYECSADLDALTPAQGLAVYRTVQEALTNAGKHAPQAQVRVRLEQRDGAAAVTVADDGPRAAVASAPGPGNGLRGMRERVESLGGSMTAGPRGAGWEVTCVIPAGVEP